MIESKSRKNKILSLLTIFLLLFSGNIIWNSGKEKKQNRDLAAFTITAEEGKLPSLITSTGELQANQSLNVNPYRQGLIEEVYVKEGDEVLRDQLIAKIDGRDFIYRLNEAKAEFEKNKLAFERRKKLFNEGAISADDYEGFRKSFLTSKARLDQIKVEGDDLIIKAPFNGTITAKHVEPGSYVSPNSRNASTNGTGNVSIVEISKGLKVVAKVPESDIGRIAIDQQANIRVEAFPKERFKAKVSDIAPRAIKNNNVTSFEVQLSLINPPKKLRIGMTVDIEFQTGETELLTLVPTVAIVTEKGEPGLLIIGKNNQPLFQKVDLGSSSGNKTAILKGINPGDEVFIDLPPWAKGRRNR